MDDEFLNVYFEFDNKQEIPEGYVPDCVLGDSYNDTNKLNPKYNKVGYTISNGDVPNYTTTFTVDKEEEYFVRHNNSILPIHINIDRILTYFDNVDQKIEYIMRAPINIRNNH